MAFNILRSIQYILMFTVLTDFTTASKLILIFIFILLMAGTLRVYH